MADTSVARPTRLTCGYQTNPLGIDSRRPRFSWIVEDGRYGAAQHAFDLQVANSREALTGGGSNMWTTGVVPGARSIHVEYDGAPLESRTRYFWHVRIQDHRGLWSGWSNIAWFETAFLSSDEWTARWIAPTDVTSGRRGPAPLLRREFVLEEGVWRARAYVSARGLFSFSINGQPIGTDEFVPGWTDYKLRNQYLVYDVTDTLCDGANVAGAILGDGWYAGRIGWLQDRRPLYGTRPEFLCEIRVEMADGSREVIATNDSWQWENGPILESDLYDGETYDARRELPGWDAPGFDATAWSPAIVTGGATEPSTAWPAIPSSPDMVVGPVHEIKLDAKIVPPVRRIRQMTPSRITEPISGTYVYDLGQNVAGRARITATGRAGQTMTLRFAEMLQDDGTLYTENLRSAKATDFYTFAGDGEITWEPRFTFHGFRFIEITGLKEAPPLESVVGVVLHNDIPEIGTFSTSHALINQLQHNIQWGQRGNFFEAPTDCPQRDERLGWTGDAQVFIPTASFNMHVGSFFTKWQRDLEDGQNGDGSVPSFAPVTRYEERGQSKDGGPAWSDAMVICPWTIYRRYGDVRILDYHYDAMKRFVESLRARSVGLIRADEFFVGWGGYGDWLSMDAPEGSRVGATPKDLIGTAYFAHVAGIMARIARLLGHDDDARRYRELRRRVVTAFRDEYVTSSGRLVGDTQTAYVLALAFDLLPLQLRSPALDRLVSRIQRRGNRLSTGFVGTPLLCPVLTRFGRADVAYKLLLQEEYPSWLYTVNQGATTMWERWNSYTRKDGFGPVQMNSFNHYGYGSIGEWMYSTVAGLSVDFSGDAPIRIAPLPGYGIESATATLDTPFGAASSSWQIENDEIALTVVIPPNSMAIVEIPAGSAEIELQIPDNDDGSGDLQINQLAVHETTSNDTPTFRVAAGRYVFRWAV